MKPCSKCRQQFPLTEFYSWIVETKTKGPRKRYRYICKACDRQSKRARDKRTKQERANQSLLSRYGITAEIRDKLADIQGGCGICGTKNPGGRYNTWNVDHCHHTGKVRGVLCWDCNVGIGKLKDDAQLLRRAIQWLEQSEQPELSLLQPNPMESCDCYAHGPPLDQGLHD